MWYVGKLRESFGEIPAGTRVAHRFLQHSKRYGPLWVFKAEGYPRIRQVAESAYGRGVAKLIAGRKPLPEKVQKEAEKRLFSWQKRQNSQKYPDLP